LQVSYSLLVFFSGIFISVEGFNQTGVPGQIWSWLEPHARLDTAVGTILLAIVVTLLSNVASNVPTVLLLGEQLEFLVTLK
jgi:Na+/H+ antiporter NhaD/arsenite permease-like protein